MYFLLICLRITVFMSDRVLFLLSDWNGKEIHKRILISSNLSVTIFNFLLSDSLQRHVLIYSVSPQIWFLLLLIFWLIQERRKEVRSWSQNAKCWVLKEWSVTIDYLKIATRREASRPQTGQTLIIWRISLECRLRLQVKINLKCH